MSAIQIGMRIGFIGAGLVLWFWTQKLIGAKSAPCDGVGDRVHEWTAPLHKWLFDRPRTANLLLIASSGGIDLFGIYLIAASVFGPTLRPFIGLLLLFVLRQACQGICTLPEPRGMIWRDPGVPSLLVTYGVGNDFFFSGHTSIAVLGAIEIAYLGLPWLAAVAAVVALLEISTVLILRAHYTMDIFAAICAAVCCEAFATRAAPFIDAALKSLI
ncbi:hypothetical protein LLG95_06045 [bacterium]|nr:hypothetical protein [bacterium]